MEEQLITKILQILEKDKITIKGNVLTIGGKQIKLSSKGGQKVTTRITQLR
jgi:hypothetical protein